MGFVLSPAHRAALHCQRRIIVNFDVTFAINVCHRRQPDCALGKMVESLFEFADAKGSMIDGIWWNWGEGNQAPYQSDLLPLYDHPLYLQWVDAGIDIVGLVLEATRRRGLETFFSHRMNGSDNDLGPFARIPLKVEHPEWTFRTPWCTHADNGYWNFALSEVHEHVLTALREVLERWPFDGLELDFARGVVFPQGEGWVNRDRLNEYMTRVREMSLEIAARRGRPLLLAARVPENLPGCHFDGLDIESWVRERWVDLLVLGVRSFDVDLSAFRRVVEGSEVKLYPSLDDHHASDGYQNPGIEVLRGVAANWWAQGADGIHTFNWNHGEDAPYKGQDWSSHLQAYRELGHCERLAGKDKIFVVQRRGGGHGPTVIPNPEDWSTPRYAYANTNLLAQLPAAVANDGRTDTLLRIYLGGDSKRVKSALLRLLLSDPGAAGLAEEQRLARVEVATIGHPDGRLINEPAAKGIETLIRVRLNNIPLAEPTVEQGWLIFALGPELVAVGEHLIGIGVVGRADGEAELVVEKAEIAVKYWAQLDQAR